ncbi:MAG: hypothetical protein R3348_02675 [Xanthomonadales bacterium]|nr:hypothetical protein [Xanthomonadales bacterium]
MTARTGFEKCALRRSRFTFFACGAVFLGILCATGTVVASTVVRPSLSPNTNQIDTADQALVNYLNSPTAGSSEQVHRFYLAAERALQERIRAVYSDPDARLADLQALAGIHVGAILRSLVLADAVEPAGPIRESNPACTVDLGSSRHLARYARAVATHDPAEQFIVMVEYQLALNCLTAWEARNYADALGLALLEWDEQVKKHLTPMVDASSLRNALFNPPLLTVDLTKSWGRNWSYIWLHLHKFENSHNFQSRTTPTHLFDYISGAMAAFDNERAMEIDLEQLLDPDNIGFGACSFLEMQARGAAVGNFGCSRGLECRRQALAEELGATTIPSISPDIDLGVSIPGQPGMTVPGMRSQPEQTPFGRSARNLSSNCGGAGGASQAGINGFAPQGSGDFMGCVVNAMVADAMANNPAECILTAARKTAADDPVVVIGGIDPATGLPIIRGFRGSPDGCATDPLAQGPIAIDGESDGGCADKFACAKAGAVEFINSPEGKDYIKTMAHKLLDAHEKRLNDRLANFGLSPSQAKLDTYKAAREHIENHPEEYVKAAEETAKNAKNDSTTLEKHGALAFTREGKANVDVEEHPDVDSLQGTLEHEATNHGVSARVAQQLGELPGLDNDEDHAARDQADAEHPDVAHEMNVEKFKNAKDTLKKRFQQLQNKKKNTGSAGQPGTQQPGSPHGPDGEVCSAMSEAMEEWAQCHNLDNPDRPLGPDRPPIGSQISRVPNFDGSLLSQPGLPLPNDGTVDPSHEQFINSQSNVFTDCMKRYGLGIVGMDDKGRLIVIGPTGSLPSQSCGDMDCEPPARPQDVNGVCRCVGDGREIFRDLGAGLLCQQSDACLPPRDAFEVLPEVIELRDIMERNQD